MAKTKHAGLGAALAVLLVVFGLFVIVGVILWMMWMQPGIQHSPSERGGLGTEHLVAASVAASERGHAFHSFERRIQASL